MEVCGFSRAATQSAGAPEQIGIDSWFTRTSWIDRISDGLFKLASGLIWITVIDRKYVGSCIILYPLCQKSLLREGNQPQALRSDEKPADSRT